MLSLLLLLSLPAFAADNASCNFTIPDDRAKAEAKAAYKLHYQLLGKEPGAKTLDELIAVVNSQVAESRRGRMRDALASFKQEVTSLVDQHEKFVDRRLMPLVRELCARKRAIGSSVTRPVAASASDQCAAFATSGDMHGSAGEALKEYNQLVLSHNREETKLLRDLHQRNRFAIDGLHRALEMHQQAVARDGGIIAGRVEGRVMMEVRSQHLSKANLSASADKGWQALDRMRDRFFGSELTHNHSQTVLHTQEAATLRARRQQCMSQRLDATGRGTRQDRATEVSRLSEEINASRARGSELSQEQVNRALLGQDRAASKDLLRQADAYAAANGLPPASSGSRDTVCGERCVALLRAQSAESSSGRESAAYQAAMESARTTSLGRLRNR